MWYLMPGRRIAMRSTFRYKVFAPDVARSMTRVQVMSQPSVNSSAAK